MVVDTKTKFETYMNDRFKKERLRLLHKLIGLKGKIQKYEHCVDTFNVFGERLDGDDISELKHQIERCRMEYEVSIILPYLYSRGVHIVTSSMTDYAEYSISNYGNIINLNYKIAYFDAHAENHEYRKYQYGRVIYDMKGNVLFDDIGRHPRNRTFNYKGEETFYTRESLNSAFIYIDGENIIIDRNEEDVSAEHFRLINGKYESVMKFPSCIEFRILNVDSENILCECGGRLYSITEGRYLSNLRFDDILDADYNASDIHTPRLGCPRVETIQKLREIMKENNVLIGTNRMGSSRGGGFDIDTMVYLDLKGNIVSDLYYFISMYEAEYDDGSFFDDLFNLEHIEDSNDTHESVLKRVYELAHEKVDEYKREQLRRWEEASRIKRERLQSRFDILSRSYDDSKDKRKSYVIPNGEK